MSDLSDILSAEGDTSDIPAARDRSRTLSDMDTQRARTISSAPESCVECAQPAAGWPDVIYCDSHLHNERFLAREYGSTDDFWAFTMATANDPSAVLIALEGWLPDSDRWESEADRICQLADQKRSYLLRHTSLYAQERAAAGDNSELRADAEDRRQHELKVREIRETQHAEAVERWVDHLAVQQEARRILARRDAPTQPIDADLLIDVLARPDELTWRIDQLHPAQGRLLVVAQRKTGKTTLMLNLARAYLTGEDFLGRFHVEPVAGTVAFLNYEVSAGQIARWARDAGVPEDRLLLVNLRGTRNPLAYDHDRQRLVQLLRDHEVDVLIVDPFARAFAGVGDNSNDAGQVNAFTAILDQTAAAAGVSEVVLANHSGWNKERGRNSTALEDWPDSIVNLVKHDDGRRFIRAEGRDVDLEEDRLDYDHDTRTLSLAGVGGRRETEANEKSLTLTAAVVELVNAASGPLTVAELEEALRANGRPCQRGEGSKAARNAEAQGLIRRERQGKSWLHHPITSHTSQTLPVGRVLTSHTSLKGSGKRDESTHVTSHSEDCPHGMRDGDKPDPFLKGRLACPECALAVPA